MMDRNLENELIEALDALEAGESVEAIVRRYPEHEAELRLMLLTARAAHKLRIEPGASAQARSRAEFLAQAEEKRRLTAIASPPRRRFALRLPMLQIFTVLLVILGLGIIGASAAQQAVPGSALYGVKLGLEDLRLQIAPADRRDQLIDGMRQERLREIGVLLAEGSEAEVAFIGPIEAVRADSWEIAGLTVQVNKNTTVMGGIPVIGQDAAVYGFTQDGMLIAETISIVGADLDDGPAPNKVEPTQTKEPMPTVAPDAIATRTPAPPIPNPTATFAPPTQNVATPPTVDDNGNENSNDNDDANSGSGGSGSSGSGGGNSGSGGGGDDNDNENSNDNGD